MKEIIQLENKLNGDKWKWEIAVERSFKVGTCAGCLFISRMTGRKDIARPERLWMSNKEAGTNKEIKENFRCGNCAFWLIKELRDGKPSSIVENPAALDRLEKELREVCN